MIDEATFAWNRPLMRWIQLDTSNWKNKVKVEISQVEKNTMDAAIFYECFQTLDLKAFCYKCCLLPGFKWGSTLGCWSAMAFKKTLSG